MKYFLEVQLTNHILQYPEKGYKQANGYPDGHPLGNGKDHPVYKAGKPMKKDVGVPARLYHHNSLPDGFNNASPTDSDSMVRGLHPYNSSKSLPKPRSRNPPPHKRTNSAKTDPQHFAQELFDKTLERMTHSNHSNPDDRKSERGGSKAKRTVPSRKAGASLSTRSSLIYSSDNDNSYTQEMSSESDVSLPP